MIRFIDEHKDRRSGTLVWGIEPIAKTLGIAPSTYHAAKSRPPSAREVRDAELRPVIARVHKENFVAYGADKMWDHLKNADGIRVAGTQATATNARLRMRSAAAPAITAIIPARTNAAV